MVDYAAVLDDLRTKRDQLAELIGRIEAFAPAVAAPNGSEPAREPKKQPRPKAAARRPHRKAAPGTITKREAVFEKAVALARQGKSVAEIAKGVGRHITSIYKWKADPRWPNTKGNGVAATGAAVRRLCTECAQKGISDPCEYCGEAR